MPTEQEYWEALQAKICWRCIDGDGHGEAGGVTDHGVGDELHRVEPDLGGLLHDGPRELFLLDPLLGGRTDHVLGELVEPVPQLDLILVERERELCHDTTFRVLVRDSPPGRKPRKDVVEQPCAK